MSVIQSKINKPFTEELLEQFLDDFHDYSEEQLRFEQGELGMHAISEDEYHNYCSDATYYVEEYYDELDLFDILDLELDKDGHFIFEDPVMDLASSYESSIKDHFAKEKLKSFPNSEFINNLAIGFLSLIEERTDMVTEKYFDKPIATEDEYNRVFIDILEDFTNNKVMDFFNKETLKKNPLYKHVSKLVRENIEKDYDNCMKSNENHNIKRPYYFKHSKDPNLTYKEIKDVLEMHKKYINLVKNKAKLPKDDPQYFNILETNSFEEMYDGLTKMVERSELEKYVKRFVGSYKNLLNEESMERFAEIKRMRVDEKKIRYHLSKISLMDDSESLNAALGKVMSNSESFDLIKMTIENEKLNAPVIYEDKQFMVVAMLDFKASQKLSASSWCISSSKSYFDNYSSNGNFNISIYDNKTGYSNPNSQIGITINENGMISYAFDKKNKNIISQVNRIIERIKPDIVEGLQQRNAYSELMNFKSDMNNWSVSELGNPVFVLNRLDKEYLKKCDFSGFDGASAIENYKAKNRNLPEKEVQSEVNKFQKLLDNYSSDNEIKSFINDKLLKEEPKKARRVRLS